MHRPGLWRILEEYGIPAKVINIIQETYKGSKGRVRVGTDTTDLFIMETGVWQGCVWSPLLLGVLIDWVLRKACDGHGVVMKKLVRTLKGVEEGWRIADFDFADDMTLIDKTGREASDYGEEERRWGLR